MAQWHNQRGLSSFGEYAITIFIAVATLTAMSVYVQRTLQARMRDTRHYMVDQVNDGCDLYCKNAAGVIQDRSLPEQYEPYYAHVNATVSQDTHKDKGLFVAKSKSGTAFSRTSSENSSESTTKTSAPALAGTKDDMWLVSNTGLQ